METLELSASGTALPVPGEVGLLYVTGTVQHWQRYAAISECPTVYWPNHHKWVDWRNEHEALLNRE